MHNNISEKERFSTRTNVAIIKELPPCRLVVKNAQKPLKLGEKSTVQSGSLKNGHKPSRDLLSMEQVWSKSQ